MSLSIRSINFYLLAQSASKKSGGLFESAQSLVCCSFLLSLLELVRSYRPIIRLNSRLCSGVRTATKLSLVCCLIWRYLALFCASVALKS